MYVRLNLESGKATPLDFDSVRRSIERQFDDAGLPLDIFPDRIRKRFALALGYYVLAMEQFNNGRNQLFGPLTDYATNSANLALELTLKSLMPQEKDGPDKRTLGKLLGDARKHGFISPESELDTFADLILRHRNALAHGDDDSEHYGIAAQSYIQMVATVAATIMGITPIPVSD